MNLKSLENLFTQAYVPYKIDKDNEWLEVYGNGQLVANANINQELVGVIDYSELTDWFVHEKAKLISAAMSDFITTPVDDRFEDHRAYKSVILIKQECIGPLYGKWRKPIVESYRTIKGDWYKRLIEEYKDLYVKNCKLGQYIDRIQFSILDPLDEEYLVAMISQYKHTKQVLADLENRIQISNDHKAIIVDPA